MERRRKFFQEREKLRQCAIGSITLIKKKLPETCDLKERFTSPDSQIKLKSSMAIA